MITCERYHDFSAGHRVVGHENKCSMLHGHNYRVTFTARGLSQSVDKLGRVIDFSVLKTTVCQWLEDHWDHKMILWEADPLLEAFSSIAGSENLGIITTPFNPTAENMAEFLLSMVGPNQLTQHGVLLTKVRVEETRKCSAEATL